MKVHGGVLKIKVLQTGAALKKFNIWLVNCIYVINYGNYDYKGPVINNGGGGVDGG
jgi:hypothetical protein